MGTATSTFIFLGMLFSALGAYSPVHGSDLRPNPQLGPQGIKVILHARGKAQNLDPHSPYFPEVVKECEDLLKTADSTYKLIPTEDLINKVKKEGALEVIYPAVQQAVIPFNQQKLYFTSLIIQLNGRFAPGTVFFRGEYAYTLGEAKPEYSLVSRRLGVVTNSKGVDSLKKLIGQVNR